MNNWKTAFIYLYGEESQIKHTHNINSNHFSDIKARLAKRKFCLMIYERQKKKNLLLSNFDLLCNFSIWAVSVANSWNHKTLFMENYEQKYEIEKLRYENLFLPTQIVSTRWNKLLVHWREVGVYYNSVHSLSFAEDSWALIFPKATI